MRSLYADRGGNPDPGIGLVGHKSTCNKKVGAHSRKARRDRGDTGDWKRWGQEPEVWPFDVGPGVWDANPGICRLHIVLSKNGANAMSKRREHARRGRENQRQ